MGSVVLGFQKDRPGVVLLIDPISGWAKSIAIDESIDPERFFVGEAHQSDEKGALKGTMHVLEDLDRLYRLTNNLFKLYKEFCKAKCPVCSAELEIEDENLVCSNAKSRPCPFQTSIERFLKYHKATKQTDAKE